MPAWSAPQPLRCELEAEVAVASMPALAVTLPRFRLTPDETVKALEDSYHLGYSGGFVLDHLWPLRQPLRPALEGWTLLAGLAGRLGTLDPAPGGHEATAP